MKKRTPLALLTATSALLIPIVPAQAAEQPKETVELHGAVGDAVNAGATALGIPGAGQMDIGRIAEGLIGVIDRAGGGGKIIDLTSGDTISIDPAVLRTLEGVAPPLKALRGLANTSGPALDLLKQIIADGDKLDLPKLSELLDKADAPSSSRSSLLDRLGSRDRSSSKPELSSRLGSLLDRNRDKETTTTPTTTSARDKQDGFKPDSVNGETTNHSLLDRLRGLGGKNGEEDTTIDAGKLDKGDYRIRGTYVDQNGEKRPVDLKLTVGDGNASWEDSTDGKDKEDKDKEGDKETTTSNSESGENSDSGSNSESGENSNSGSNSGSSSDKGNTEPTDEVDTHAQKPEKRVMPISDNTDGSSSENGSDSSQQGQTTPTTANGTNNGSNNGASNGSSTINQNRTVGNTQRGNATAAQNTTPAPAPNNTANTNAASQNNPESLPTTGAGLRWVGLGAIALAVVGVVVLFANRKKTAK